MMVVLLWGIVGLLQKLGANRISPKGLIIWTTVGYALLLPGLFGFSRFGTLGVRDLLIGIIGGTANGLGAWYLYASMEKGAKASIVVPLTALSPLLTIALAMTFLRERLTLEQWIGAVTAVVAGAMLSYEKGPNSDVQDAEAMITATERSSSG
jgi:uncharacterized membrane protein